MFNKKTLFLALALTLSTGVMAFADDGELPEHRETRTTNLTRWNIDSQLSYADQVAGGTLTIDTLAKQVTLFLYGKTPCAPNMLCTMIVPEVAMIQLPIVDAQIERCGVTTVTARQDARPVDGALEEITIRDSRQNLCPNFIYSAPTAITYRTEVYDRLAGETVKTFSRFQAEPLQYAK